MKQEVILNVVGVEKVDREGVSKDGKEYKLDWTEIHHLIDMDISRGEAVGQTVAKLQFGTAVNFETLKAMKFPVKLKAQLTTVMQGNRQVTKIVSLSEAK